MDESNKTIEQKAHEHLIDGANYIAQMYEDAIAMCKNFGAEETFLDSMNIPLKDLQNLDNEDKPCLKKAHKLHTIAMDIYFFNELISPRSGIQDIRNELLASKNLTLCAFRAEDLAVKTFENFEEWWNTTDPLTKVIFYSSAGTLAFKAEFLEEAKEYLAKGLAAGVMTDALNGLETMVRLATE